MVELKAYPAKNGEAFLVKATDDPFAMLIDGGYADIFRQHVVSDLKTLAASGYALYLIVATHIDVDHISGLLSFFRLNGRAEEPLHPRRVFDCERAERDSHFDRAAAPNKDRLDGRAVLSRVSNLVVIRTFYRSSIAT